MWASSIVQCPFCGTNIDISDNGPQERKCRHCSGKYYISKNVIQWRDDGKCIGNTVSPRQKWSKRLKTILRPLQSPILPFTYLSALRIKRFYKRTLTDLSLAKEWQEHYLNGLDIPGNAMFLDFGCGRGRTTGILSQLGFNVAAQDIYASSHWQKIPGVLFQKVMPSERLPWKSNSFDVVVMVMVVHYLDQAGLDALIGEIRRVLRPNGYWILLEANKKGMGVKNATKHFLPRLYSLGDFKRLIMEQGFSIIDQTYEGFYSPVLPMWVNYIRKQCMPIPLDISDYKSWLARRLKPERRALWLLRARLNVK